MNVVGMASLGLVTAVGVILLIQVRQLSTEGPGALARLWPPFRSLATVIGWVVIVAAVDLGLGLVWSEDGGGDLPEGRQAEVVVEGQIPRALRPDRPAWDPYPWAEEYLDELALARYDYEPFIVSRLRPTTGRFINTGDGVRHGYVGTGDEPLDIWFFGGSTMWGEGQRDDQTIPSAFTRLAERAGIAVRATNFGHQGDVSWQEMLRFEAELAARPAPDLAVFYDGPNDLNAQLADPGGDPTHLALDATSGRFSGGDSTGSTPLGGSVSLLDRYREVSVIGTMSSPVVSLVAGTAVAAQSTEPDGGPASSDPVVEDVLDAYGRAVEMIRVAAESEDVPVRLFWQPVGPALGDYRAIAEGVPDGVVSLINALDSPPQPLFVDGSHTNELGANIVAAALFEQLEPDLLALQRAGP